MRPVDIIAKKRDGQALTDDEIAQFISGYTSGDIPDYQAAAFLMAVYLRGMSRSETVALTLAMARSGHMLDLSDITDYAVDKHSSGGVGDKTTLIVLPLVASMGVPVAKMSGRGLGFSGGTLDKLESIAGFNVNLSETEFKALARQEGIVLAGQTGELAPADGKLYALRDVTATVSSVPLIASSIMSKKLASGANGMVLDVKWGNGAFMETLEAARQLAETMVRIGVDAGRDVVALLSDMNQPLGRAVGNALEVAEAVDALRDRGPADLREHCLTVAAHMVRLAGRGQRWTDFDRVRQALEERLQDGSAFAAFRRMVIAQGGDVAMIDDPARLPHASTTWTLNAQESGYVAQVSALDIARAANALGAGREKKGEPVDHAVGVVVDVNVGDQVQHGQDLLTLHANDEGRLKEAKEFVSAAIAIQAAPVKPLPLFYGVIGDEPV